MGKIKRGFTLAEVLITLTIIGVVASLTIPTLINNTNNYQNVVALKKFYSDIQQAFMQLQAENGGSIIPVFQNDTTVNYGNGNALNAFLTKMNFIKNCRSNMGCWHNNPTYYLNGSTIYTATDTDWNAQYEKAVLANGTQIMLKVYSTDCTTHYGSGPLNNKVCANLYIDINGGRGPNVQGRDYFQIYITQTGIYPRGAFDDGYGCSVSPGNSMYSQGCTAKVLSESAINY